MMRHRQRPDLQFGAQQAPAVGVRGEAMMAPGRVAGFPARAGWRVILVAGYLVALLVSSGLAWRLGSFSSGFAGADEPSHFVNALFVARYIRDSLGLDPLAAAFEFYLHYPKLSIGQWPPLHYGLVGLVFLAVPATYGNAMLINAVVVALPAVFVAWAALRLAGPVAAVAAAAWYGTLPIVLHAGLFFMTDQAVTSWVLAAAVAWLVYLGRGTLPWALLCAVCAAAGILTKGNAWQIGLVPLLHMLMLGDASPLRNWRSYAAGALTVVALAPWYIVTWGITAESWMEQPGLAYAARAGGANFSALVDTFGVGLVLAAVGLAAAWRGRAESPAAWRLAALCASVVAANFLFQLAVPASLESRFLTPSLPPLAALAAGGAWHALRWLARRASPAGTGLVAAMVGAALLAPGAAMMRRELPKVDMRLAEVAETLMAGDTPALWVIDGTTGAEGGLVAEAAARDTRGLIHVARASRFMADSNFTGQRYELRITEPADAVAALRDLGAGAVVLVQRRGAHAFPHSAVLDDALRQPGSGWTLVRSLPHRHRAGVTLVFKADAAVEPNLARLRQHISPRAQRLALSRQADE